MSPIVVAEIAASVCVLAAMSIAAAVLFRRFEHLTAFQRVAFSLFPLSQIACTAALLLATIAFRTSPWIVVAGSVLGIACIPVDALLFKALAEAERRDVVRERARLLEDQVGVQKSGAEELMRATAIAREIRFEAASSFRRIDGLLAQRAARESERTMDDVVALAGSKSLRLCDHDALDALVNMKKRELEREGVEVTCVLRVPRAIPVSSAELCALFANLLDNALSACRSVPEKERAVSLRASVQGPYLVIDMRNAVSPEAAAGRALGSPDLKEPTRHIRLAHGRTSEGSIAEHGWGTSVVELVAERYDGAVTFESEGGWFRTSVMLHLGPHT